MTLLRLGGFTGEIPRLLPRLLPENAAQVAAHVRLTDGGLVAVRRARIAATLDPLTPPDAYRTIFRDGDDWLAWTAVVDVARGPVAQDRLYYTGDGAPKMRVAGDVYDLAVPAPSGALSGTPSGSGTGPVFTRLYVYTFVTDFGEESEPSPASDPVSWQAGQTVTLSGFAAAPAGRAITKQRIYRSQTGTGGTELFFIAERAAAATNFVDSVDPEDFGEALPSRSWNAPPADLEGLTSLPNGMMAAFTGRDLYFCEPWRPHAWPEAYVLTTDHPIVALGAIGGSLVVATAGTPYIVTGSTPDTMVMERIDTNLPCVAARSLVDLGYSIAYATPDGIAIVSQSGAQVVTEGLFNRDQWQTLSPETMIGGQFNGRYVLAYDYIDPESGLSARGAFLIDLRGQAQFLVRADFDATALFYDLPTGGLYYAQGAQVWEWDPPGETPDAMRWRSKPFVTGGPVGFGVIRIDSGAPITQAERDAVADATAAVAAANAAAFADPLRGEMGGAPLDAFALGGDALETPPSINRTTTVDVYADGVFRQSVTDADRAVRLKSGFTARRWEVDVRGTLPIERISIAESPMELAQDG